MVSKNLWMFFFLKKFAEKTCQESGFSCNFQRNASISLGGGRFLATIARHRGGS